MLKNSAFQGRVFFFFWSYDIEYGILIISSLPLEDSVCAAGILLKPGLECCFVVEQSCPYMELDDRDEEGGMKGSALVMEFPDRAALDDYLAKEPYVVAGV